MKILLSLFALLCFGANLANAQTLEDALRESLRRGWTGERRETRPRKQTPPPIPADIKYLAVDACWSRPADATADAAGLPARFCLKRIGLINSTPGQLPFSYGSNLVVDGEPASGRLHIGGGSHNGDHWNIVGNLFGADQKPACGRLTSSFAAVYVNIDLKGELIDDGKIQVRGFLVDHSDYKCKTPARAVQIDYSREQASN